MSDQGIKSSELQELLRALQTIEQIEIPTEEDSYIESYFSDREKKAVERRVRGAQRAKKEDKNNGTQERPGAGSGTKHWTAKRKRLREYYRKIAYPRIMRKLSHLVESEGWYDVMVRGWKQNGWDVQLTREEWNTHVEPILREKKVVPYTERYYTNIPVITIDNILIYPRGASRSPNKAGHRPRNEQPVFDGAEHKMRRLGYII